MRKMIGIGLVLILSSASMLEAQTSNASLTGRVADSTKAVISDARVRLISKETNLQFEGLTNQSGLYYIKDVPPGTYSLRVEQWWPPFHQGRPARELLSRSREGGVQICDQA